MDEEKAEFSHSYLVLIGKPNTLCAKFSAQVHVWRFIKKVYVWSSGQFSSPKEFQNVLAVTLVDLVPYRGRHDPWYQMLFEQLNKYYSMCKIKSGLRLSAVIWLLESVACLVAGAWK